MDELTTIKAERDTLHRLMFGLITSGEGVNTQFLNKYKPTPIAIEAFQYYLINCRKYYDALKICMAHEAHKAHNS